MQEYKQYGKFLGAYIFYFMKTIIINAYIILSVFILTLLSCKKKTDRYSFWRGDIENYYYILDMNDQPLYKVKGKPFLVMEYDPANGYPLRVEFGLFDAKSEILSGAEGVIPEPFISTSTLKYAKRMNLYGPASILCNWCEVTSSSRLPSGDFEFYIDKGPTFNGHEILFFTFTPNLMDGEIRNPDASWGGRISDPKAFKLMRLFNSNTIEGGN